MTWSRCPELWIHWEIERTFFVLVQPSIRRISIFKLHKANNLYLQYKWNQMLTPSIYSDIKSVWQQIIRKSQSVGGVNFRLSIWPKASSNTISSVWRNNIRKSQSGGGVNFRLSIAPKASSNTISSVWRKNMGKSQSGRGVNFRLRIQVLILKFSYLR